jgi:3-methyladenine DNA glycosylase AlkD
MDKKIDKKNIKRIAARFDAEIRALKVLNAPNARAIRRRYSRVLKKENPDLIIELARILMNKYKHRWAAYELIKDHKGAFTCMRKKELEEFGQGINSWWTVDSYARTLSGPAWLNGQVADSLIHKWARSRDLWWRRAALVSTVALNVNSHGGYGDTPRTLAVCKMLVKDHEDMIVKAMSWALRMLSVNDPAGVRKFLKDHDLDLAARVKREVRNKLKTGLKNPKN